MFPLQPAAETPSSPPGRTLMVCSTIALLTAAFYCIEHDSQVSTLEVFSVAGDELAEKSAEGDATRRLAISAIGLFGAMLLLRRDGRPLGLHSSAGWLIAGYLAWCGMSMLWSETPSLTLRHFGVLLLLGVGALGIARHFDPNALCLIALPVAAMLIANGVRTEIALGTFHPLSPEYRFAGTLHPNLQATYCAMMTLSAAFLASRAKRGARSCGCCVRSALSCWC